MTAPILDTSANPSLPTLLEGTTNPAGITIADLIADGSITDPDGAAVEAIAITGLNTSLGAWQYSLDSGAHWLTIQADQINSTTNELVLLLGPTAMIRLLPFGDLHGTLSDAVTFRAWDESSGSEGQYVVVNATGGETAFSAASQSAGVTVTLVNTAPSFSRDIGTGGVTSSFGKFSAGEDVVMQPDGKIVVAGVTSLGPDAFHDVAGVALARYDADGALDASFAQGGTTTLYLGQAEFALLVAYPRSVALQADGKILVASYGVLSDHAAAELVRYNTDGTLDSSFGAAGTSSFAFDLPYDGVYDLAVQPDGKIVAVGALYTAYEDFAVTRVNADGTADTSFNGTGAAIVHFNDLSLATAFSVKALSDGKLLVAGTVMPTAPAFGGNSLAFALAKFNPDGTLDTTFNGAGTLVAALGPASTVNHSGLAVQSDGSIVMAGCTQTGSSVKVEVVRYGANGSLDTSFNGTGKTEVDFGGTYPDRAVCVGVQADGKILIAGSATHGDTAEIAVARLDVDGTPDTTFGGTGQVLVGFGNLSAADSLVVQPDGKIVISGWTAAGVPDIFGASDFAVVRLNADGSLDGSFGAMSDNSLGGNVAYTENANPIALDSSVAIHDTDLAALNGGAGDYAGARATLSRHGSADAHDLFSALGNLSFGSGTASLSGVAIGTYANGNGALSITFNDNATQARVNEVLSSIGYANSSDAPPSNVQIDWSFSDGNNGVQGAGGALTAAGSTAVTIAAFNDPPTGTVNISGTAARGQTLLAGNNLADLDGLGTIAYQWQADGINIPGETSDSLLLGQSQVGKTITVVASYADGGGTHESVSSGATDTVTNGNAAPVLDASASPSAPDVLEHAANPGGISVASLVVNGSITDPDGSAVEAIAITGLNTSLGAWQYSLDNGAHWLTIQADQLNSTTNELALLLGPTAMIRLLPFGDLHGTLSDALTFRAWDESSGSEGQYVAVNATGADTAFSAATDAATASVNPADSAPTFASGGTGSVFTDFDAGSDDEAMAVAIGPDGRIVLVGTSGPAANSVPHNFAVARYDSDGSLDATFGGTGKASAEMAAGGFAAAHGGVVQADGKILLIGSVLYANGSGQDFGLARFNADGSADTSFGGTGSVLTDIGSDIGDFGSNLTPAKYIGDLANGVALQPDGKIVVAGYSTTADGYDKPDFSLARYNADGSLDTSFNGTGETTTDISSHSLDRGYAVASQADGKTLVAGYTSGGGSEDFAVVRYNADGSLDTTFNGTGKVVTDIANGTNDEALCVATQADGKILVAGYTASAGSIHIALVRYNANGSLDTTFNGTGKVVTTIGSGTYDAAYSIDVLPTGKIVVVGSSESFTNGSPNPDKIAIVRYNADGNLDTSFNQTGISAQVAGTPADALVQPDGKIVVAVAGASGQSDFAAFRFNADGTLDTTFGAHNTVGGTSPYIENGAPISLDSSVGVYDTELAALAGGAGNYAAASISLGRHGGVDSHDLFSALGGLSFSNGNAVLSGVTVGTVVNSGGHLTITFNSNATQARVNAVLSDLAYANSSDAPPAGVVIDYVFSDGNTGAQGAGGAQATAGSVTVNITEVNDAPTGAVNIAGTPSWGATLTSSNTLADADGLGTIGYQWRANGSPVGGATGSTFLVTPDLAGETITVTASYVDLMGHSESTTSAATSAVPLTAGATGTAGPDNLTGNADDELLSGLAGNDTINGGAGNDTLIGGTGNDSMNGGDDSDLYIIATNTEHPVAEIADTGSTGIDEIRFAATSSSTLTLFAGDTGIERVVIGTGTGAVAVSTATTALGVNAAAVGNALWIIGNAGANTLTGTAFNDTLDGGAGNDKMIGGNGNDTYFVDSASDSVTEASATGGIDLVVASIAYTLGSNVENLTLAGSAAINGTGNTLANTIAGNSARNVIDGKAGVDALDGADGGDLYVLGLSTDHTAAEFADSGSSGADEVRFAATKAGTLTLFAGDTGIEQVTIGTGTGLAAVTTGTAALNVNAAAVGNALTITGNAGVNILVGTAFNDTLSGGKGSDLLTGGGGADAFVFNFAPNASSNKDTITDFTSGTDVLQLSKAIYTAVTGAPGGLTTEQFWAAAGATVGHDADDRIIYNTTTGALYYDADGNGGGASVQIALLGTSAHPALAYTDIALIA
jgi:uncharacterized delta-60 repeat protein